MTVTKEQARAIGYAIALMKNARDVAAPAHVPIIEGHINDLRSLAALTAEGVRLREQVEEKKKKNLET